MDPLECRSPRRCPTCEHWLAGGCELERQIDALDAPRAPLMILETRPMIAGRAAT